jgi:hypothetical protein
MNSTNEVKAELLGGMEQMNQKANESEIGCGIINSEMERSELFLLEMKISFLGYSKEIEDESKMYLCNLAREGLEYVILCVNESMFEVNENVKARMKRLEGLCADFENKRENFRKNN